MGRRNWEWPRALSWSGFFTQDVEGGVTESVGPEVVKAALIEDGFVFMNSPTNGSGMVYDTALGKWRERKVIVSTADPEGTPADGDIWFQVPV